MIATGSFLYNVAALGFAVLSVLLLAASRTRGGGSGIVGISLITALWAAANAFMTGHLSVAPGSMVFGDAVRYSAWLAALAYGANGRAAVNNVAGVGLVASFAVVCLGVMRFLSDASAVTRLADVLAVLMPAAGMSLLALRFVRLDAEARSSFVYLGLGFGMVMACDMALYLAAALPAAPVTETWALRGAVASVAPLLIALAISHRSPWPFRLAVSRDVAFYLVSGVGIGAYFLLCLALGQLVPGIAGRWGGVATVLFYGAAAIPLIAAISSGSLRKWLRVLLTKHFFEHKYDYREEWLRFIATLSDSQAGEDPRRACLRAVAQIIDSPVAMLVQRSEGASRFECVASWPGDGLTCPSAIGMLDDAGVRDELAGRGWVVDLAASRATKSGYQGTRAADLPPGGVTWRLIVPVLFGDELAGAIYLQEPPGGLSITFEDLDLLKTAARHVATHLAQYAAERRLAEIRQFEAYSRLAAFMVHDLKNVAAQLQLVVSNAERHRQDREFIDDAIDTVSNAARRIDRLIGHLARDKRRAVGVVVDIDKVVATAVQRTMDRSPKPTLVVEAPGIAVGQGHEELGNVVEHLIRNAQDATPADGRIAVGVRRQNDTVVVSIADNGRGMTAAFIRDRLFQPFDSTQHKGGMGLGAYQARVFARSMGGDVEVESAPGVGTTIRLIVPATRLAAVS